MDAHPPSETLLPAHPMQKTVLIVDDCSTTRFVLPDILGSAGYQVLEAEDGKQALQSLDGRAVHLAVCDLKQVTQP